MNYKIAIIGPKDIISGFKALGVVPFDAETGEQALPILKKMKKDIEGKDKDQELYATVLIIESVMEEINDEDKERLSQGALPAILALPGIEGSKGAGVAKLKRLAERAIGSDILG